VPLSQLGVATGPFVERSLVVNLILIVFNMIPAFPMDGGRCVRALLGLRLEYAKATRIAAGLGQVLAVGLVVLGLFSNPFLMLIGVFVWIGAAREARYATLKAAFGGIPLRKALMRDVPLLPRTSLLAEAAELLRGSLRQHALVVDDGNVVGTLSLLELIAALQRSGPGIRVEDVTRRDIHSLSLDATMDVAFSRLQETRSSIIPVLSQDRLVGTVTLDGLDRFLAIEAATARFNSKKHDGMSGRVANSWPVQRAEYA
jgi:CBS domain-containing protein